MADALLKALSGKPGAAELTLVDGGTDTGYSFLAEGRDFGNAEFDPLFSGPRGTQGAKAVGAIPQNRRLVLPFRVRGSDKDELLGRISVLHELARELRRFGGRVTWRAQGQTYRQHFEVMAASAGISDWPRRFDHSENITQVLSALCAPYLKGDPMDVTDDFSSDRLSEYTFDAGVAGNVAVSAGELDAAANLTTENRVIHTAYGYTYGDHQATLKTAPGATITSYKAGVLLKRIDALNYLEVYVDDNGTNSRLRLDKIVAGSRTNLSSTNLAARVAAGTRLWVRGRIQGNVVFLEHWNATTAPTPTSTPTTSASYTLTTAEAATFGYTVEGGAGWVWTPQHTDAKLDDFEIQPFTYGSAVLPEEISLRGVVPGDAPALADLLVTPVAAGLVPFAMLAWWERIRIENRCWNGDFESAELGTTGWSNAAVTNINGAATSIARVADSGLFGANALQIVCPATADTGASFRIFRKFERGVTYTFDVYVRSAAGVTNVYARIGNGAANDKASSSNTPLSTTRQKLTVTWTPSADRADAHIAVNIAAATGTTFQIDGISVYEGTVAPTGQNQIEGRGGFAPLGIIEAENGSTSLAPSSDAGARGGFNAGAVGAPIIVDPSLLVPDDHTAAEVAVEVWARVKITTPVTSWSTKLTAEGVSSSGDAQERYSLEYGSAGRFVTLPTATGFRFVKLGTLILPTNQGRMKIREVASVVGAGGVAFDYFVLVPLRQKATSPTGKTTTDFPYFVPVSAEVMRRIRCDLSGTFSEPTKSEETPASGLGGALLELPPGNVSALVKLSSLVPDDPSSNAGVETLAHIATIHFALTPRWHLARS